ncbi:MAG TPA: hypothetical protein VIM11_27675 [Tepidisphaeraceae bacterium]
MIHKSTLNASSILLCLLLLPPSILALGYIGTIGVAVRRNAPTGINPAYETMILTAGQGRVRYWIETDPSAPSAGPARTAFYLYPVWPFRPPEMRRSIWEFDAHALVLTKGGATAFILACPIWCVALPWLVFPGIWLWRRRRQRHNPPEGFSVVEIDTHRRAFKSADSLKTTLSS